MEESSLIDKLINGNYPDPYVVITVIEENVQAPVSKMYSSFNSESSSEGSTRILESVTSKVKVFMMKFFLYTMLILIMLFTMEVYEVVFYKLINIL